MLNHLKQLFWNSLVLESGNFNYGVERYGRCHRGYSHGLNAPKDGQSG